MISPPTVDSNRSYKMLSAQLRLIVWYNLDLITAGEYISEDVLTDQVLDWIPKRMADSLFVGVKQVHFIVTGVQYGTDIVSQYTYNEIKTQFATHPYGMFAVNLDVWYINTHCQIPIATEDGCITGTGDHETSTEYPAIDPE